MRRLLTVLGAILWLAPLLPDEAVAGPVAKTQCDSYTMKMSGTTYSSGVSYTEYVRLEKVQKSGNVQGKWKLADFQQTIVYPGPLPISMNQVDHHDLGQGMWMDVRSVVSGNVIHTQVIKTNAVLDVVGNRIGYVRTNVWCGTINGQQVSFKWHKENPLEPTLQGTVTLRGESLTVELVSPKVDERYVFSEATPGVLTFTATAKTTPASYAGQLIWDVESIPGSDLTIEPADKTGPTIKVTYSKLPRKNSDFGPKKLSVRLRVGGCEAMATSSVRLFFPANAKNHPSGQNNEERNEPNWFYYWKQTRAAVGPARYGGGAGLCVNSTSRDMGYYLYQYFPPNYVVCDLGSLPDNFRFKAKIDAGGNLGDAIVHGIDTFAVTCHHENAHYLHFKTWWKPYRTTDRFLDGNNRNGIREDKENALDADHDLVPDSLESQYGLDPTKRDTYGIGDTDEELLAWFAEASWKIGSADKEDWSKPGNQWP